MEKLITRVLVVFFPLLCSIVTKPAIAEEFDWETEIQQLEARQAEISRQRQQQDSEPTIQDPQELPAELDNQTSLSSVNSSRTIAPTTRVERFVVTTSTGATQRNNTTVITRTTESSTGLVVTRSQPSSVNLRTNLNTYEGLFHDDRRHTVTVVIVNDNRDQVVVNRSIPQPCYTPCNTCQRSTINQGRMLLP